MSSNRFGISALSKQNKEYAVPKEIMIDRKTGEILIKTDAGDIISYDSLSRVREHINTITASADNLNILGDIYLLSLDNIELPGDVPGSINLLPTPLILKNSDLTKLLVSVDLDCVELSANDSLVEHEPNIKMVLLLSNLGDNRTLTKQMSLSKFNSNVIILGEEFEPGFDYQNYQVTLQEITILQPTENQSLTLRNIIHSIIVMME